jgi:hypothetical protein
MKTLTLRQSLLLISMIATLNPLNAQKAMKNIETEIIINADKETVWNTLTAFDKYQDWNPFISQSSGKAIKGQKITNVMKQGEKTFTFKPTILHAEKNKNLEWMGHLFIPGLFDGRHYFRIEELSPGKVKLVQGEHFKGLFSGMILKKIKEQTTQGFIAMNEALKKECEK